ncbi:MAG: hypothetical protein P8L66_12710 [Rhodospirillaceae bacterium]|nr:hypothetical protein [Rhodospirillaceae bacterium]
MKRALISLFITVSISLTANAQTDYSYDGGRSHSVDFGTIDDGWLALETVSAEIRAAVQAGNMTALRGLSDQLFALAGGLATYENDVPQSNRLRFTSSINQLRSLSERILNAHERNDVAAAERMVLQLDGMVQILIVSAEAE